MLLLNNQGGSSTSNFMHIYTGVDLSEDQWHRVVASVDPINKKIVVFLDGKNLGEVSLPADFILIPGTENSLMFTDYSSGRTFYGLVDNLMVYDRALSAPEIYDLFQGTDQSDTDGDGIPNSIDPDDDNDNVADDADTDPLNEFICRDADADGCDDCSTGIDDPANDGADTDGDGLCDIGDNDADGDGFVSQGSGGDDCDDFDPDVYPGAPEIFGDGIDQDCDGVDPVEITPGTYYIDPVNGTDDTAHGTTPSDGAWKSLHFAVEMINSGAVGSYTLNLAAGMYSVGSEGEDAALVLNQDVVINGSDATLDGTGASAWTAGLVLGPGAANVTIRYLTIRNFESGILINSAGGCVNLENVTVEQNETGLKIVGTYQTTVDMTGSSFTNNQIGLHVTAGSSNNVIRYGEFSHNSGDGIRVEGSQEAADENRFESIHVLDNGLNGIIFYDGWNNQVTDCVIRGNNTGETSYGGVAVLEGIAAVNWNVIENNGCHGVYAEDILTATPVDAAYNWWGAADGPGGAGPGSGNPVSENVVY